MTLEDQIRRMAEARAAEAGNAAAQPAGRRWWLGAAAAAVATLVVGAVLLWPSEDTDVDTADDLAPDDESTINPPESATAPGTTAVPTSDPGPTTAAPANAGPCAANPAPADEILDLATHLGPNRTPFDLDDDGVPDELLTYDGQGGDPALIARLRDGWAAPVTLRSAAFPGLLNAPDGAPAAADFDEDGRPEFFVSGYGNTAWLAAVVTLDDRCRLVGVGNAEPDPTVITSGTVLYGGTSNSCLPTGCSFRVGCVRGGYVSSEVVPREGQSPDDDPSRVEMTWRSTPYTLTDGVFVAGEATSRTFVAGDPPPDAPSDLGDGSVDCTDGR